MTIIVGLIKGDTVYLGADSACTTMNSLNRTIIKDRKVFIKNDCIAFGVCGLPKVNDALAHGIELPRQKAATSDKSYLVTELVPVLRRGLINLDCVHQSKPTSEYEFTGAMLIGYRGELYQLQCNFQLVSAAQGFDAVGSGAAAALGSLRESSKILSPTRRINAALQRAVENNAGCAPPFVIVSVKKGA